MDVTWGIEIETDVPARRDGEMLRLVKEIGDHSNENGVNRLKTWYDGNWQVGSDAGRELRSPIYTDATGLVDARRVCRTLLGVGASVGLTQGLHVHVGHMGVPWERIERAERAFTYFERVFYGVSGWRTVRRYNNGTCVNQTRKQEEYTRAAREANSYYHGRRQNWVRGGFSACNFENIEHPTIEFRCFTSSINPWKVSGAILLATSLMRHEIDGRTRDTEWGTPVTNPIAGFEEFAARYFTRNRLMPGVTAKQRIVAQLAIQMDHAARDFARSNMLAREVLPPRPQPVDQEEHVYAAA